MSAVAAEFQQGAAVFLRAFAEAIAPRRVLSVSEWADAHRILSAKASSEPGEWRTSRMPFLREIQDCLSVRSPVQRVVMIKCSQIGGTEVGLNWIGYVMSECPSPMLVVLPTIESRRRWGLQRLEPMLRESPGLKQLFGRMKTRDSANGQDIKDFPSGGILVLGGANSPASLASMPIRFFLGDEVDRYKWDIGGEGDPVGLIRQRQKNFPRRKELLVSSPTIKGASRVEEEYEASDQRRYHLPCPHCTELLVLRWGNLQWTVDRATGHVTHVAYACEHCGSLIEEHHKRDMLSAGRWIPAKPGRRTRGYHINALYSPIGLGNTWAELVEDFLASKDDPIKLKRFVNTQLGETWEDRSRMVKASELAERAEPYRLRQAPPGCLLLTAGIDTQDDRLAVLIVGWGRDESCWIIDWVELPGSPSRPQVWMKLSELLNTPIDNTWGHGLVTAANGIDTGGHHTHEVYHWVRSGAVRRPMALKGASTPNKPILAGRPTHQDVNWRGQVIRKGVKLWTVGVDTAKHMLMNRLHADQNIEAAQRKIRFSKDLDEDFYKQLTAEIFDPERNRWVKRRGIRNEVIDCFGYAAAAAQHPEVRVHTMRKRDWDRLERVLESDAEPPAERPAAKAGRPQPAKPKPDFPTYEW